MLPVSNPKELLIIFTRNPQLGKCKTRLAATVGDEAALNIYIFLLKHTVVITQDLSMDKQVYYSEAVRKNDLWSETIYTKKQQVGDNLGIRMRNAFDEGFRDGYEKIVLIGSDMYDLNKDDLRKAFDALAENNFVIGPALDGGYYLMGLQKVRPELFQNKNWGTSSVLNDTLSNLKNEKVFLLPKLNDVDLYEDIKDVAAFQEFFTHLK